MNKMSEKDKFNNASILKDNGDYQDAIKVFNDVLNMKRVSIKDIDIYTQIAGCYFFDKDFIKSLTYFTKVQKLDESNELASLGLYLSLVEQGKTKDAINELNRYSSKYSIDLYRDTVKELMIDISNGNATSFKDIVYKIGRKHDVSIKPTDTTSHHAGTTSAER